MGGGKIAEQPVNILYFQDTKSQGADPLPSTDELREELLPFTLLAEVPQLTFSWVPLAKTGSHVHLNQSSSKRLRQLGVAWINHNGLFGGLGRRATFPEYMIL